MWDEKHHRFLEKFNYVTENSSLSGELYNLVLLETGDASIEIDKMAQKN